MARNWSRGSVINSLASMCYLFASGFIDNTRERVEEIKKHMASPEVKGKMEKDKRELLMRRKDGHVAVGMDSKYKKLDDAIERDNEEFIDGESTRQQLLVKKQDEQLDTLSLTVNKLGQMGLAINEELEVQHKLIGELDEDTDKVSAKLKNTRKQLNKLVKRAKGAFVTPQWRRRQLIVAVCVCVLSALLNDDRQGRAVCDCGVDHRLGGAAGLPPHIERIN